MVDALAPTNKTSIRRNAPEPNIVNMPDPVFDDPRRSAKPKLAPVFRMGPVPVSHGAACLASFALGTFGLEAGARHWAPGGFLDSWFLLAVPLICVATACAAVFLDALDERRRGRRFLGDGPER